VPADTVEDQKQKMSASKSSLWLLAGLCALAVRSPSVMADVFELPAEGDDVVGEIRVVVAKESDTLLDIARQYDLGYNEIIAANPNVDPWLPKDGTPVILPTRFILPDAPRKGVVLNVAKMRLYYYQPASRHAPAQVVTHPVGVGRPDWNTPVGKTRVVAKQRHPAWFPPASVRKEHAQEHDPLPTRVPPGADNPLGDHAWRLKIPGYLIHGTNRPWGVGMRVSHGCVRLYPEDAETLFTRLPVGTTVTIVEQPVLLGSQAQQLYLQAFSPENQETEEEDETGDARPDPAAITEAIAEIIGDEQAVDWEKVLTILKQNQGIPLPIAPGTSSLADILMTAPVAD